MGDSFEMTRRKVKTYQTLSFSAHPGDIVILNDLMEFFGSGRSDVIRTALRHFAAHLSYTQGFQPGRGSPK